MVNPQRYLYIPYFFKYYNILEKMVNPQRNFAHRRPQ